MGLGWNTGKDGWDLFLRYTWMRSRSKQTFSGTPFAENAAAPEVGQTAFFFPWATEPTTAFSIFAYNSVESSWRLRYNVIDLEMGRKYWLSNCFTIHPYMGIRFAWNRISFHPQAVVTFNVPQTVSNFTNTVDISFRNKYWGGGFIGGIEPTWYFGRCFGLYGRMGFSLLWGEFDGKRTETSSVLGTVTGAEGSSTLNTVSNNDFSGMQNAFEIGLGLRYEDTFCCDRYQLTFDAGWEHHQWIDHVHRILLNGETTTTSPVILATEVDELSTDLSLGGFVLRLRFDF